jgi:Ca2+-binding RTX toxin-like protein
MFALLRPKWTRKAIARKSPAHRKLLVEELATRALPSASPITLGGSGTLSIRGTIGDDTVVVAIDANNSNLLDVFYNDSSTPLQVFDLTQTPVTRISFSGYSGNDYFSTSTAITCKLNGGYGNDTLVGGSANDRITGGSGDDNLSGGGGDDTVSSGAGNDVVDGGDGSDRITGDGGNDNIVGGTGDDTITGGSGDDGIFGGDGNDSIGGGSGNDAVSGGDGNDLIHGNSGNDAIDGNDGDDHLWGDGGDDVVDGGSGNDSANGGSGNDFVGGGIGDDSLLGGGGNDTIDGGMGDDWCDGGNGLDDVEGGVGDDDVIGDDVIVSLNTEDYWVVLTESTGDAIGSAEILTSTDANGQAHAEVQIIIVHAPANTTFDVQIDVLADGSNIVTLGQLVTDADGTAEFQMSDPANMPTLINGISAVVVSDLGQGGSDELRGTIASLHDNWLGASLAPPHDDLGITFGAAALNLNLGRLQVAIQGLVPNTDYYVYVNGDALTGTYVGMFTTDANGNGQFEMPSGVAGVSSGSTITLANVDGLTAVYGTFAVVSGDDRA